GHSAPHLISGTGSLLRLLVWIDQLARLVFGGRHHHLGRHVLELREIVTLDIPELDLQDARLRPFAVGTESHVAEHGLKRVGADVIAELGIVEAVGSCDGLLEDLELGVAPAHPRLRPPRAPGTSSSGRPHRRTASSEPAATSRNWSSR